MNKRLKLAIPLVGFKILETTVLLRTTSGMPHRAPKKSVPLTALRTCLLLQHAPNDLVPLTAPRTLILLQHAPNDSVPLTAPKTKSLPHHAHSIPVRTPTIVNQTVQSVLRKTKKLRRIPTVAQFGAAAPASPQKIDQFVNPVVPNSADPKCANLVATRAEETHSMEDLVKLTDLLADLNSANLVDTRVEVTHSMEDLVRRTDVLADPIDPISAKLVDTRAEVTHTMEDLVRRIDVLADPDPISANLVATRAEETHSMEDLPRKNGSRDPITSHLDMSAGEP